MATVRTRPRFTPNVRRSEPRGYLSPVPPVLVDGGEVDYATLLG
jgi:hypothetical protein